MALLGPNGAGKSTLVMAIAGTLRNRAGVVRFAGADLIRLAPHRIVARGIAVVPEGRRIFAPLSGLPGLRPWRFPITPPGSIWDSFRRARGSFIAWRSRILLI